MDSKKKDFCNQKKKRKKFKIMTDIKFIKYIIQCYNNDTDIEII